jgi:hypothetical protein
VVLFRRSKRSAPNLYTYSENDPLNFVDVYGLSPLTLTPIGAEPIVTPPIVGPGIGLGLGFGGAVGIIFIDWLWSQWKQQRYEMWKKKVDLAEQCWDNLNEAYIICVVLANLECNEELRNLLLMQCTLDYQLERPTCEDLTLQVSQFQI